MTAPIQKKKHSLLSNIGYVLGIILRENKLLAAYLALEIALGAAAPFFGIYLPKLTADLVTGGMGPGHMAAALGRFVLVMMLVSGAKGFVEKAQYMYYNNLRMIQIQRLFDKNLSWDYQLVESSEGQKLYQLANHATKNGDASGFNLTISQLMILVVSTLCFFLYASVLAYLNPLIVLLLIATALINYFALQRATHYASIKAPDQAAVGRKMNYIRRITSDPAAGKDIRIYGMKGMFMTLFEDVLGWYMRIDGDILNRQTAAVSIGAATTLLRDGIAYVYLIARALSGAISVGDFLLYFGAIAGFGGWITSIISAFTRLNEASVKVNHMRGYLEQAGRPDPNPALPPPEGIPGITLDGVSFSYAPDARPVIDDFTFSIAPGEKVALVGVNGAGKTTLVKLLCGFYQPVSGRICIGGVDTVDMKREDIASLYAAVFQEAAILPVSIAENVSMRRREDTDVEKVRRCLREAGLWDAIDALPNGEDTPLTRAFDEDGIQLSGGQHQRLLLARALYKDAPILVLDEPTAALDPIAESEVYARYFAYAQSKTSLFISHRLASTRFCDRIIFMHEGKPAEVGTHDELMRQGGLYAEMFHIQSRYYKEEGASHA